MPDYTTGSPKGNSHETHVIKNNVECYTCHSVTLANSSTIGSTATHVDKVYNIDLLPTYDAGDPNYDSGSHTCDNASCHGGNITPPWGNTIECESCHGNAYDVDDYARWTNFTGVVAQIYTSDFTVRGHGRTTGNYDITGNGGADRVCKDCHDQTAPHGGAEKPFRTQISGDPDTFCLSCHGSGAQLQGAFSSITGIKSHTFTGMSEAGGYQNHTSWRIAPKCIDCHDPHGDGNIAMIHDKVHTGGSDDKGRRNAFFNKSTVVFRNHSNADSFANSSIYSLCQACHTKTSHFRQEGFGGASDQLHSNIGGAAGKRCTPTCHNHRGGFAHGISGGSGGAGGTGCVACHGHEKGTLYDPDMQLPVTFGSLSSMGAGTATPHSTHTETDADDKRGPAVYCSTCHDINNIPYFKSGTDANGDGRFNLSETDVCDACHSPAGSYDGVDDPSVGAKNNWHSGGVYNNNTALKAGKEKWCAGCHDDASSYVPNFSNISAPNVIGNETSIYTYGQGYGFYKTGHGLPANETVPSSGGIKSGPGKNCPDCHNITLPHIDGNARTFDCSDGCDSVEYQAGYRLRLVGGLNPMEVPRTTASDASDYRLCFSCHDSAPFLIAASTQTNFLTANFTLTTSINRHEYHLVQTNNRYVADYDGAAYDLGTLNSRITCLVCHNVHGSTQLAMIRDASLMGRNEGIKVWYRNDDVVYFDTTNTDPPSPEDLPLSASTGAIYRGATAANVLCTHCHFNNNTVGTIRNPFKNLTTAPQLDWTGDGNFIADGANPDSGVGGAYFEFRVKYTDTRNLAPGSVQVWIDVDDDNAGIGGYEATEKFDMIPANSGDGNYTDGNEYSKVIRIYKGGDNTIKYRFYASDGTKEATGDPTINNSIAIVNNSPVLDWTAEKYYVEDGVNPDRGSNGSKFVFRVSYTDNDDECPPAAGDMQVWIDANDVNSYEGGEMFNMSAVNPGDTSCSDGKFYVYSTNLSNAGDGTLNYTFRASDGFAAASGPASEDSQLSVTGGTNSPPALDWATAACLTDGVRPLEGATGADYQFMVSYTDPDNDVCPPPAGNMQVWIDENDASGYEAGEKHNMTAMDAGDNDCSDGKLYAFTRNMTNAGTHNYRFYGTDGMTEAVGFPTMTSVVTVVGTPYKVRPEGGAGWYTTIQTAVTASSDPSTLLVYPNSDFTAAKYTTGVYLGIRHNRTIRSVCGAELTKIAGGGSALRFQDSNNGYVSGFTLMSSDIGFSVLRGNNTVIRDSIFRNNSTAVSVNTSGANYIQIANSEIYDNSQRGIYANDADMFLNISSTRIYNNTRNGAGAGAYFNYGTFRIVDSEISNNVASAGAGGGVYYLGVNAGTEIVNSVISGNQSSAAGGGLYLNSSNLDMTNVTFTNNIAATNGGAMSTNSTNVTCTNCIIAGNEAATAGVMQKNGGTQSFINTTFAFNKATTGNGGVFNVCNLPVITVRNSIFWGNSAAGNGSIANKECGAQNFMTISDSDIYLAGINGGTYTDEGGNINPARNPSFVVHTTNYRIQSGSPVIDQANAAYAPANDIDGEARPSGDADDMGADEHTVLVPDSTAAGTATAVGANSTSIFVSMPYTGDGNDDNTFLVEYCVTSSCSYVTHTGPLASSSNPFTTTITALTLGETYNVRLTYDDPDTVTGSPVQTVSSILLTNTLPDTPSNSTPANSATAVALTPTLTASAFYDADSGDTHQASQWQVDDNADFGTPFYDSGAVADLTSHTLGSSLSNGTVYYWRVRYQDSYGEWSIYSTGTFFTTLNNVPDTPTNGTPADGAINVSLTPTLTASAFFDPDAGDTHQASQWQVDDNIDFSSPAYDSGSVTDLTSHNLGSSLGAGTTYYWRVRYEDDHGGWSSYSAGTSFTTLNNAPHTPTNSTPADGATDVAVTPALTASVFSDPDAGDTHQASQWQVSSGTGAGFDAGIVHDSGTTAVDLVSHALWTTLSNSTVYYWRVRYQDNNNAWSGYSAETSFTTVAASGATHNVCPDQPAPYDKIQTAIADAGTVSGDTLSVCANTWSENIDFLNKNITVKSAGGAGVTIIQGAAGNNTAVVTFNNASLNSSAVLDGFTIDNQAAGSATRGIYIGLGATPTIKNSIIQGNSADNGTDGGGGVYVVDSSPSFDSVTVRANTAQNRDGAGMYIKGAAGGATITNSTIGGSLPADGNSGANSTDGAGIYFTGSTAGTLSISGSTIRNNVATGLGGGIYLGTITNATVITNTTITENQTNVRAAGIFSLNSPLTITNSSIDSNTSLHYGSGLYLDGDAADATITGGSVDSNIATSASDGAGAGLYLANGADLSYSGGSVSGNIANAGNGGGIYAVHTGTVLTLARMNIKGNRTVQRGGGMYLVAGTAATITNSIISGNTVGSSTWEEGGGIRNYGSLEIYNSTIAGNYGPVGGGLHNTGTANIKNSIFWSNVGTTNPQINGTVAVIYTDVQGGLTGSGSFDGDASGTGNLNVDPSFVLLDAAGSGTPKITGDYHINTGSAVVDQAKASGIGVPADDIDGDSRSLGTNPDMGADEKE
ncbi:MAG: right-handed parallel beta-helix repeat-containing protein [Deltaproteobacteria bacterium]|nr:right-handed parallel beta-helix repeat-containing protein [Deltaproteobacteria bacterium]